MIEPGGIGSARMIHAHAASQLAAHFASRTRMAPCQRTALAALLMGCDYSSGAALLGIQRRAFRARVDGARRRVGARTAAELCAMAVGQLATKPPRATRKALHA